MTARTGRGNSTRPVLSFADLTLHTAMTSIVYCSIGKRKARKPTASQRKLAADWEALLQRQSKPLGLARSPAPAPAPATAPAASINRPPPPSSPKDAKAFEAMRGSTAPKQQKSYTGTECLGVTVVHKSGLQPVFSKQEAVDAAKMRR